MSEKNLLRKRLVPDWDLSWLVPAVLLASGMFGSFPIFAVSLAGPLLF